MTRYAEFLKIINTPEKLTDMLFSKSKDDYFFDELIGTNYCHEDCEEFHDEDCVLDEEKCRKCKLKYLNESIEVG